MTIKKITIYEIEERGIILNEPCQSPSSVRDTYLQEYDEQAVLELIEEANEQALEEPIEYFGIEDYYPLLKTDKLV